MWSDDYAQLEKLCAQVPYAPESVPCYDLDRNRDLIKEVALTFRGRCGLGDREPALNLFATIERLGLKCLRRPVEKKGLYGVSACSDQHGAFVFVNTYAVNIERQIFTVAHELGHLIFHRADFKEELTEPNKADERETEKVADWFAGNFLMPEAAIRRVADSALASVEFLIRLKRDFGVSYMTMLRRLSEITGKDYGQHIKWFRGAYRGAYQKRLTKECEPAPLASEDFPENERHEALVKQALREGVITTTRAAELLQIPVADMRAKIRQWKRDNGG
jgi:Zn-dependent peptidase ImmA (M78 family)